MAASVAPAPTRPVVMARHQRNPTQTPAPRAAPTRLKVIIRRLPPGLTEAEFIKALGDGWKVGGEQIDWLSYKEGKISRDMSKQSRPARAYLHLTKSEFLTPLSNSVREANFTDAKNTVNDACLLGPPLVEFSSYGRVPTSKPRKDARQGTIDQDLEFIDFLQELTNPVIRPAPLDAGADKENAPVGENVTPLVQYLRDKKANKGKESAPAKGGKQSRQEAKDSKGKTSDKSAKTKDVKDTVTAAPEKKSAAAAKVEKVARDAVKVLNKQAAAIQKAATQSPASIQIAKAQPAATETRPSAPPTAPAERKRGKVGAEAKNLLQRDLGLGGSGGRRRRGDAASTPGDTTSKAAQAQSKSANASTPTANAPKINTDSIAKSTSSATNTPSTPTQPQTQVQPPTGPAASRSQQAKSSPTQAAPKNTATAATTVPNASASTSTPTKPSTPSPPSTQAFLKHANPSQGITEPLLQEAFVPFGSIKKVEIDKKKGFAYIEFAEPDSLRKAIAASPVKVAQGQVVVLERKEKNASTQNNRSRGGRGPARGRGGGGGRGTSRADKGAAASGSTGGTAPNEKGNTTGGSEAKG